MRRSSALLSLLLTCTLNATDDIDALFKMSLEDLMDIEITGSTRTLENPISVPASVSVFTQKDISELGVSTLEELKNYAPGFSSRRSSDNSLTQNTVVRGYQSGEAGRDVLIIIDGQRLNSNWNGGAATFDANIALENIQRVEFIRGASSSIYGSNAFSAIINLITIKDKNFVNLKGSSTALNTSALVTYNAKDFQMSGFIKGVLDEGESFSGLKDSSNNGTTTAKDSFESQNIYVQMKYKDLSIYASHKKNVVKDFYVLGYLSNSSKRDLLSDYLRMSYDIAEDKYKSQIALSYKYKQDKMREVYVNTDLKNAQADVVEDTIGVEWFNSYKFNAQHNVQFGLEYQYIDTIKAVSSYEKDNYTETSLADLYKREVYSLYAQYQAELMKNMNFTAGLRYDKYTDFGDSLNPRFALVYIMAEDTSLKMLYSSAFRAPSKVELDTINNPYIHGNSKLDAEKINTYEIILMHHFNTQSISFSLYRNEISNLIVKVPTLLDANISTYENASNATFDGIELEYKALFFKSFSTRLGYSNVFNKPEETFRNTSQMASVILNYASSGMNLNLSGYYHNEVQNDFNGVKETLDAYAVVNSKISYTFASDLQVYIHLKNLLNEEYFTPTNSSSLSINLPNRGREIFLGLGYSF